jgi:CheY-like chemotaxis protein
LTDVVMPDMGGRELALRLKAGRRDLKVLFMSGYADDTIVQQGVLEAGAAYLQKPFTPDALASKVREVLDTSG